MLEKLKSLLGISDTSKDTLLLLLIDNAEQEYLSYTHRKEAIGVENLLIQMAVYNYNRLGTEGVDSENYSGVSFGYSTDYPESIIRQLKSHRKVVVI